MDKKEIRERVLNLKKILYMSRKEFMEWIKEHDRPYYDCMIESTAMSVLMSVDQFRFPYIVGVAQSSMDYILEELDKE